MIHMEVDLHSPSFRALRSFSSSKRARSPESFLERPTKRPLLAIDHSKPGQFTYTSSSGNATPQSPASGSSRFPSEEWVHQADGLSIDSPVIPESGLAEDQDEDINMDPDELIGEDRTQRPDVRPLQTISFTSPTPYHQQHLQHHEHTPLSASSAPTPSDPLTALPPPTPAVASLSTTYVDAPPTRPSTPVAASRDNSAMLLSSPATSFSVANITSPRRQRFTMGPRSDCIKCQLGVKGHSVHY